MPLADYLEYLHYNRDDSPLYFFHRTRGLSEIANWDPNDLVPMDIQEDYTPSEVFGKDLLVEMFGEHDAPANRWLLIGPKRSGSATHRDPNGTSAWNTSI